MGHIGISGLKHLYDNHLADGFVVQNSLEIFDCAACIQAKHTCALHPKLGSWWQTMPGELTYTDVWGPAQVPSLLSYWWYISFVNDATWWGELYYMKTKDEAATYLCEAHLTKIEWQLEKLSKTVRADNGCEYVNHDLIGWRLNKRIELQTTAPYMPEQNGVTE